MEDNKKENLLNVLEKIDKLDVENNEKFKNLIKVGEVGINDLISLWEDKERLASLRLQTTKALMLYESFLEASQPKE